MDEINITATPTHKRPRRTSGFGSGLMKLLFFLASLIPMCIIAWRMDLVNSMIHPQPVVVQQPQVVQPQPRPAPPQRRAARRRPAAKIIPATDDEPLPRKDREPTEQPEPRPNQEIAFDLTDKIQRQPVTLSGPLRIARIDGCIASLSPSDGNLEQEVVATLDGPRPVTITMALQDRDDGRSILIEPTIINDAGKSVPFTKKNFTIIARRVTKNGRNAASQLAALNAERSRLRAWVDSPVAKPLVQRNQAVTRIRELGVLIPQGQRAVAALENEARVIQELGAFAERLQNDCAIVIEAAESSRE
jgi:hypothetical protein